MALATDAEDSSLYSEFLAFPGVLGVEGFIGFEGEVS